MLAMCRVLDVTRSGYYAWKRRGESPRDEENRRLDADLQRLYNFHKGRYGAPRLTLDLRAEGWRASRRRVAKRLRMLGLRAKAARKFKATTQSKHGLPTAPNRLEQDFTAAAPNRVWLADITYVGTDEGWLYLAVVLDVYSRAVVGWAMAERITRDLVIAALTMAVWRRRPAPGLIAHSDRGSQYASGDYQAALELHGFLCSMSRKGNCYDNAAMESFFHSLNGRAGPRPPLSHQGRGQGRHLRVYRDLLQPDPAALDLGLPVTQGFRESEGRLMNRVSTRRWQDQ